LSRPSTAVEFWYEGEIGFFDFYIIPLAKKLKSCGVFGVSSEEYLQYAMQNRMEWSLRGKDIVEEYLESLVMVSSPKEDGKDGEAKEEEQGAKIQE
jgi:hypothetical protein